MKRLLVGAAVAAATMVLAVGANAQTSEPVHFTISNDTEGTMNALYLATAGSATWEDDILNGTVDAGETLDVTIDDDLSGCEYDMRADFTDGSHIDVRDVNFCELEGETISFTE
jgi:opacity protein-like surface antigen